jgi:hypothetical protein
MPPAKRSPKFDSEDRSDTNSLSESLLLKAKNSDLYTKAPLPTALFRFSG